MALKRLNSCCCCGLHQGVIAIGIICLVVNGLGVLVLALGISQGGLERSEIANDTTLFDGRLPTEEEVAETIHATRLVIYSSLAIMAISMLFDVLLLVSASLKRYRWLIAWMVWYTLLVALLGVFGLYLLAVLIMDGDDSMDVWAFVVGMLIEALIGVYLIAVVVSYYLQLREEHGGRGSYAMQPVPTA